MDTYSRYFAAIVMFASVLSCRSVAANTVAFQLAKGTWPLVPVYINGEGPFTLLIDTGSTKTVIDKDLAASMDLKPLGQTTVRTPTGVSKASLVRLDRVSVAGQEGLVVALVTELSASNHVHGKVQGILGFDFLSRYRFFIDYRERRLGLYEREPERLVEGGDRITARIDHRRLLLATEGIRSDGSAWLALDTGAERLVVYDSSALELERDVRLPTKLRSAVGSCFVTQARVKHLQVGMLTFRDLQVSLLPQPIGASEENGLLPGNLFDSVFVDPARQIVVLNATLSQHAQNRTTRASGRRVVSVAASPLHSRRGSSANR